MFVVMRMYLFVFVVTTENENVLVRGNENVLVRVWP